MSREPPGRPGFRSAIAPLRLLKRGVLFSHSGRDCPVQLVNRWAFLGEKAKAGQPIGKKKNCYKKAENEEKEPGKTRL